MLRTCLDHISTIDQKCCNLSRDNMLIVKNATQNITNNTLYATKFAFALSIKNISYMEE